MRAFSNVAVWRDGSDRTPEGQMSLDEAILRSAALKVDESADLRFYLLPPGSVTIGFFMPFEEASGTEMISRNIRDRPLAIVRRLTGGGIVVHGNDVTFSLAVGRAHRLSSEATAERYHVVHEALRESLVQSGAYPDAVMVPISLSDSTKSELCCFSKPVGWDILDRKGGEKIAGGAQRRTNGAWLHQGTVQIPATRSITADWTYLFAEKLGTPIPYKERAPIEIAAQKLEESRYSRSEWNERI